MSRLAVLTLAVVVASCDRSTPQPPPANAVAPVATEPEPAIAKGCADHWTVALDAKSFANNGAGRTFPKERLDAFLASVAIAATGAVNEACKAGEIAPASAVAIKSLVVVSASGAADPVFAEPDRPATLRLEYVFAETDLTIPSEMELRAGLVCWADPDSPDCAALEP